MRQKKHVHWLGLMTLLGAMSLVSITAAQNSSGRSAGAPPGMSACGGKLEGRYAGDQQGTITLIIHGGQATMLDMISGRQQLQCWTDGKQLLLRESGKPENDMNIDINSDGSLQVPIWGTLRRKGD